MKLESTPDKMERYKRRFPGILMNIFAASLCLSVLAWIIPAIGRSYWTQHPGDPTAYIWLGLVVIGVMWNLYAIGAAVRCAIDLDHVAKSTSKKSKHSSGPRL